MQGYVYNIYNVLADYFLGLEKLLRVQEEKDLGVVISDKLTWHSHAHLITAKANNLPIVN